MLGLLVFPWFKLSSVEMLVSYTKTRLYPRVESGCSDTELTLSGVGWFDIIEQQNDLGGSSHLFQYLRLENFLISHLRSVLKIQTYKACVKI